MSSRDPIWAGVALGLLFLSTLAGIARASDDVASRATLKGIRSVHVDVTICDEIEKASNGIPESAVQTDAELRLRQAGVMVASASDTTAAGIPGGILYLTIGCGTSPDDALVGTALLASFSQWVELPRLGAGRASVVWAETWSAGTVGLVGKARLRDLRAELLDRVDQFLNAYLAANPKQGVK